MRAYFGSVLELAADTEQPENDQQGHGHAEQPRDDISKGASHIDPLIEMVKIFDLVTTE